MEHAKNTGLVHRAERNKNSKLKTHQVEEICKLLQFGYRNCDIAKQFDLPNHVVAYIRAKESWAHISCKYKIPARSRLYSPETIHWLCRQIKDGLTNASILQICENKLITEDLLKDLRRNKSYAQITRLYNL
jgi:hypothetical protein